MPLAKEGTVALEEAEAAGAVLVRWSLSWKPSLWSFATMTTKRVARRGRRQQRRQEGGQVEAAPFTIGGSCCALSWRGLQSSVSSWPSS